MWPHFGHLCSWVSHGHKSPGYCFNLISCPSPAYFWVESGISIKHASQVAVAEGRPGAWGPGLQFLLEAQSRVFQQEIHGA